MKNSKKFWQRGPVSKILGKPGKAFEKTFRVVRGRKSDFEALARALPRQWAKLEGGLEVLDEGFPIREGEGRIDYLLCNGAQELTFVWMQRRCSAESLSKLLPDYHWIQKNGALWPHLFPQVLRNRGLQMRVWVFALEIDPDLQCLLAYLQGVRIQVFLAHGEGERWSFQAWKPGQSQSPFSPLPSSPGLTVAPPEAKSPAAPAPPARPLLTAEELRDLTSPTPEGTLDTEDETTDPHYQLLTSPKLTPRS